MPQNLKHADVIENLNVHFDKQSLTFNRGVERETLRVDASGKLAQTHHPVQLGSKLTHPTITTDFSEAQLELITPVSDSIDATLKTLNDTHRFVYKNLGDEILWASSMPCALQNDNDIPLAKYGNSNLAKLKTTYRHGLGVRYGRSMQTICAVHYNFSFSDSLWNNLAKLEGTENTATYRTNRYFDVMRNFRRFSWLAIYLSGASPSVCNSFVKGRKHTLEPFDEGSMYLKHATSLRNGNLGYQSDAQSELIHICYNGLENYVHTLANAVDTPYPSYTKLSEASTEHVQVNDSILQSEAEFYTTIRAKRVPDAGQNFLAALLNDGVEYIEVRLLDVNPFQPLGVDGDTMRFIDTLLLHCLLSPSLKHDGPLCASVKDNVVTVVADGRDTQTLMNDQGQMRSIKDWGQEILNDLKPIAAKLDIAAGGQAHTQAIELQQKRLDDSNLTPSGQVIETMQAESIPFFRFAMNQSLKHRQHFLAQPLSNAELDYFNNLSEKSIRAQQDIESQAGVDFDTYLKNLRQEYSALND